MNKKLVVYAVVVVVLLTGIYATDFFQISPGQQSLIFWGGTEDYINFRIRNTQLSFSDDLRTYSGFNYGYTGDPPEFVVYRSQTGFYGTVLKLLHTIFPIPVESFLVVSRIFLAFFLAVLLTALAVKIQKNYGWIASTVFVFFCGITYWLIGPSKHIIWIYFTLFLPFVYSIFCYNKIGQNGFSEKKYFFGLFLLYVLVFLGGYTFITCISLAAAIPIVYRQIRSKDLRKLFRHGLLTGMASILAFLVVLGIHFLQLRAVFDSGQAAYDFLIGKAIFRTQGIEGLTIPLDQLFLAWARIQYFYLPPQITNLIPSFLKELLPINMIRTLYFLFGLNLVITLLFSIILKRKRTESDPWVKRVDDLVAIGLTCAASLAASWSWFPAKGHMIAHPHMNGIMFVLPFGLTLYFFTGVLLQFIIDYSRQRKQKT